jgi:hypothetical protein
MTLIELLVASGLMIIVCIAFYGTLFSTSATVRTGVPISSVEEMGRRVLDAITNDLRPANSTVTIIPTDGSSAPPATGTPLVPVTALITALNQGTNADGTANYTNPSTVTITYTCVLESTELADGRDNDGDWLVDEGMIQRDQGGATSTIAYALAWDASQSAWVFAIGRSSGRFNVGFTLQASDGKGNIVARSFTTSVKMRN